MNIKPLGTRILLEIAKAEATTQSGIIIPVTAQEKTNRGTVVSVGAEVKEGLSKGQTVVYDKYAGTEIVINDAPHLIIDSKDILAIIEQ